MKRIFSLALVLVPCLFTFSCKKGGEDVPAEPAQLGVKVKNAEAIYEIPKSQSKSIELTVVADPTSAEAYNISLAASQSLVATYNLANGTNYEMLPASAFTFVTNTVTLPKYNATSSSCELRLKGEGCVQDQVYVLPVAIENVQGGTNFTKPDEKAAFILFKMGEAAAEGAGTQASPYLINSLDTFFLINGLLKDDTTVYFKLTEDLDFKDVEFGEENPWKGINYGADDDAIAVAEKRGIVFDGNNHKISNFKAGAPLFYILVGGVENLTIENAEIAAEVANAGGVLVGIGGAGQEGAITGEAAIKNVTIKNAKVENDRKRSGGLISWLKSGSIENATVECEVKGGDAQVGGLAGRVSNGSLINCSASGNVTNASAYSGGLVGIVINATIKGCHATGNVEHTTTSYTRGGGLIGQIDGNVTIEKCYATGNVTGISHMGGGLVGVIGTDGVTVSISECYATGNVTLPNSGNYAHAGGLVGTVNALGAVVTIENCYATGTIVAKRYSGGFVGSNFNKDKACKELKITNSYTTCDITGIVLSDACGLVLGLNDGAKAVAPITPSVITCTGFVAWNTSERPFSNGDCVSIEGNYYGTEGTVSQQAKALGWSESIWDLTGDLPKLKNVK